MDAFGGDDEGGHRFLSAETAKLSSGGAVGAFWTRESKIGASFGTLSFGVEIRR